jgi:hypothetical protein
MSDREEVIAALNKFEKMLGDAKDFDNYCRGLVGLADDIRALAVKWGYKKVKVLKEK